MMVVREGLLSWKRSPPSNRRSTFWFTAMSSTSSKVSNESFLRSSSRSQTPCHHRLKLGHGCRADIEWLKPDFRHWGDMCRYVISGEAWLPAKASSIVWLELASHIAEYVRNAPGRGLRNASALDHAALLQAQDSGAVGVLVPGFHMAGLPGVSLPARQRQQLRLTKWLSLAIKILNRLSLPQFTVSIRQQPNCKGCARSKTHSSFAIGFGRQWKRLQYVRGVQTSCLLRSR